jgi:TetR/AcrR family transcriptional repressor of lmrAB and yxaGH operons
VAARSDVRSRMVTAGEDLLSHRGYGVTMLDVVAHADAPRGSIYYHFPGGKPELVLEVAAKVRSEIQAFVAAVARKVDEPGAFLKRLVDHHRKRLAGSDYTLGCPLMGVVVTGEADSPELAEAIDAAFTAWVDAIAAALAAKGFDAARSRRLATVTVVGVEGAIVLSRARRSTEPFLELSRTRPLLVEAMLEPTDR